MNEEKVGNKISRGRFKIYLVIAAVFLFLVYLTFSFTHLNQESNPTSIPTPNSDNLSTSKNQESEQSLNYQKIALGKLQGSKVLKESFSSIEVVGTITKTPVAKEYFIIKDDSGFFALIGSTPTFINKLSSGDKVVVDGFYLDDLQNLGFFNSRVKIPQEILDLPKITPVIMSGDGVKVISKSANLSPTSNVENSLNTQTTLDLFVFQTIHISEYDKNPPQYLGQRVKILSAMTTDFLARGDRGGDSNFVLVVDAHDPLMTSKMMLEVDGSEYQKAVASLKNGDLIIAYAIGIRSQSFNSTAGQMLVPTVQVLHLDKCDPYSNLICSNGNIQRIF